MLTTYRENGSYVKTKKALQMGKMLIIPISSNYGILLLIPLCAYFIMNISIQIFSFMVPTIIHRMGKYLPTNYFLGCTSHASFQRTVSILIV